jgi:hypothetical protein
MSKITDILLAPGTHGSRPATPPKGSIYPCTTHSKLENYNASGTWVDWFADTTGGGSALTTIDDPSLWGTLQSETYEFDANNVTSLPSGWSWVNQGTATYLERYGAGGISCIGNASYNNRGLTRAEPAASTYTAVFKMSYALLGASSSPAANVGVWLRNSTSGKSVQYAYFSSNNVGMELANSATSYSSNSNLVSIIAQAMNPAIYFRIKKNSSTSYDFGLSANGVVWDDTVTGYNPTTHLTTTTDIGFYFNSNVTTRNANLACHWLRVV